MKVGAPVVVVGNLTVGGTGKTPLVAWLSTKLAATGMRVAIVSRGYGGRARGVTRVTLHSRPSEVGDEPLLLARRAHATVFIGRDRVAAARTAVADGADIVLCDDGLQHLALVRQCEIVVIDGQRGFGNGRLLPRGPLRESPRRLRRVNAVVINGALTAPGLEASEVREGHSFRHEHEPRRCAAGGAAAARCARSRAFAAAACMPWPPSATRSASSTCCARPGSRSTSTRCRIIIAFKSGDLNFGDNLPVLMTEKDAVKCAAFADERCWYVPVTAEFAESEARELVDLILARVQAFKTQENRQHDIDYGRQIARHPCLPGVQRAAQASA